MFNPPPAIEAMIKRLARTGKRIHWTQSAVSAGFSGISVVLSLYTIHTFHILEMRNATRIRVAKWFSGWDKNLAGCAVNNPEEASLLELEVLAHLRVQLEFEFRFI